MIRLIALKLYSFYDSSHGSPSIAGQYGCCRNNNSYGQRRTKEQKKMVGMVYWRIARKEAD